MDLSVLHTVKTPDRDYRWKDKLNSTEGHLNCRLLEWTGWYSQDIFQRLLGHYRLYKVFKAETAHLVLSNSYTAYISYYKSGYRFRSLLTSLVGRLYYVATLGEHYAPAIVAGINKQLLTKSSDVLLRFLEMAEVDFTEAIATTIHELQNGGKAQLMPCLPTITVNQQFNQTNQFNTANNYSYEYNQHVKENSVKGKAKGVFSKKQWLIVLDLLAESKTIEPIDYTKPNRFENVAALLQALSGKSKDSILGELKDVRNEGLYTFQTAGELKQLIATISNIGETFRKAGFRSVAKLADKKIKYLEMIKNDNTP